MYLIWKLIHVTAVILFLGNIITGLFWKAHADRSRDVRFIAHTMEGIIRADRWFTIPGFESVRAAPEFRELLAPRASAPSGLPGAA